MRFAGGLLPGRAEAGARPERQLRAKLGAEQYSLAKSVNGASVRWQDRDRNAPKTENTENPHGGQCWLDEMPLTEY